MFKAVKTDYLVPVDGSFRRKSAPTGPPKGAPGKKACVERLDELSDELDALQRVFYADGRYSLLLVFQAMDAAGKDGTIRAVMRGINPAGCRVHSFKQPSAEELGHDFLWRTARRLPERGRIGIFNRSYYEEVLVVRVHPEYLGAQNLPSTPDLKRLWRQRYQSIRDHEEHLARNGTIIVKFWLNVSRDEQRQRFLDRIHEADKNWKFSVGDVAERAHWDDYMDAYEDALRATSRPWAPWYAIPADKKPFMRLCVAETIVKTMKRLRLAYPRLEPKQQAALGEMAAKLEADE